MVVIVTEAHNRLGLTLSVDVTGSNYIEEAEVSLSVADRRTNSKCVY